MSTLTVAPVTAPQQPGGLPIAATSQVAGATAQPPATDSVSISQTASAAAAQQSADGAANTPVATPAASDAAQAANAVQAFEQAEAPPPYTLQDFQPNPNRENARSIAHSGFTAFQGRQFADLLKTLRSITSAVLPNFSYSA